MSQKKLTKKNNLNTIKDLIMLFSKSINLHHTPARQKNTEKTNVVILKQKILKVSRKIKEVFF